MGVTKETIEVLISEEDILKRIKEMGQQITEDYAGEELMIVPILKGGSFFGCELAKNINLPVVMDFMATSSYGSSTVSSGDVKIKKDLDCSAEGKHVLIVEDIIDSGNTLSFLLDLFATRKVMSVYGCALLNKPDRRVAMVSAKYVGFDIPDKFVVGYGLDYDQKYRNLPYIGVVNFD